jgi:ribosomal protein L7/L12
MTSEAKQEVEKLLHDGQKSQAVQYLSNTFQVSLDDARMLVETLEMEIAARTPVASTTQFNSGTTLDGPVKQEVIRLLEQRQKIEAVKYVKNHLRTGLKEALLWVEEVARETDPNYSAFNATGCVRGFIKAIGVFLAFVALMFFIGTAVIYYFQERSVSRSDLVEGKVTEVQYLEEGQAAPVISFQWKGKQRSYASNTYSDPPDYRVGQAIPIYVNREEPDDVLINTFEDRYALLVGLGVIGAVFGGFAIVCLYFARAKF